MKTAFAPAERAPQTDIRRQHEKLAALPLVREFLDAVPNMSVVLNKHRQIIFANQAFVEFLGVTAVENLLGKNGDEAFSGREARFLGRRPGEAVGCIHANKTEGGCGTTRFCQTCGAVIAILNSQRLNTLDIQECRMICGAAEGKETALDLRVWSRPVDVEGEAFTIFSLVDISDEKRRQALERIFFHDVINTAGGVKGAADLMTQAEMPETEMRDMANVISESADQLMEEISAQQMLSAAERGDLQAAAQAIQSGELLAWLKRLFHSHDIARGKTVVVDAAAAHFDFVSDLVLLRRVLINLAKNALEAVAAGGTVTLGSFAAGDSVGFTVHNATVMPTEVQLQIFARSFSTKGSGRGLGTYSVKLITEKYLHGHVSFVSNAQEGTRFTVRFPRKV